MNKLLVLSIVVMSVSLYGAENIDILMKLGKENKELRAEVEKLKKEIRTLKIKIALGPRIDAYSITGLEGIAKDGLDIVVEDYSEKDKTFDAKAIKNQIELRLRQSGIKVANEDSSHYLHINAYPIQTQQGVTGYSLSIDAKRAMNFKANGKTYRSAPIAWSTATITPVDELRQTINEDMDDFLLANLKANPKKKEKE